MKYKTYLEKMRKHDNAFGKVWIRMLRDTNKYCDSNPESTGYGMCSSNNPLDIAEHLIFNGVWIIDRIEGVEGKDSKKSLRKKVRKVLGYTYP